MAKMCDLTNEDITRIVTDIFAPKRIPRIQRHKKEDYIACNVYTEWTWTNEHGTDETVTCCDEVELRNPFEYGSEAIYAGNIPTDHSDYTKLRQFCFAHGMIPDWIKHNPYLPATEEN